MADNGIQLDINIGDIGVGDLDVDLDMFDILPQEAMEHTRYTMPKMVTYNESDFVLFRNAKKIASQLKPVKGMRVDAFLAGDFIFGDFIEAWMVTQHMGAPSLTITTLSMSQDNVDSLKLLLDKHYIGELNLLVSHYFYAHERHGLIPYIYETLDVGNRFQLAVAGVHTKTVHFRTYDGMSMVIHGSANLRSSGNVEQITIEENEQLYNFYDDEFKQIFEKYATIRKPLRHSKAWDEFEAAYERLKKHNQKRR